MLIDSYVHVGDWKYFKAFGRLRSSFQEVVDFLESRGFSGAALIPSELKKNEELLREITDYGEKKVDFRCWFFPWLNPGRKEDRAFVERHISRIDGFKFHPSLDQIRFSSSEHRFYLETARDYGLPILVHCGAWEEIAHYRFVLDVAERFPEINFILAHQGGSNYELKFGACLEVKEMNLQNVYMDLAGTHEYWIIEECVSQLGAERFFMGSDFPIRDSSIYPVIIDNCRLTPFEKERIKGNNFLRIMTRSGLSFECA